MKTVKEVSDLTGISVRTLHYYDQIGLLHPEEVTDSGYRLYGAAQLQPERAAVSAERNRANTKPSGF